MCCVFSERGGVWIIADFYVWNEKIERIGIVDHWESFQWQDSYRNGGEVKVIASNTPENIRLLQVGNRIQNTDENTIAKIRFSDFSDTVKKENILIRAVLTSRLLDDRVVMATESITNVEAGMYSFVSKWQGDLRFKLAPIKRYPDTVRKDITWGHVFEAQKELTEISTLGFTVLFDQNSTHETFTVYKGVDRANDRTPDYVGTLSLDSGNIQEFTYSRGVENYKNVAIVAGEGDGKNRKVVIVSIGSPKGEGRKELYVDAKDIRSTTQVAIPTGKYDPQGNMIYTYEEKAYTGEEYAALLRGQGLKKLAEQQKTFSVSCVVDQRNMMYGRDYFLGDRIPIYVEKYNLYASAMVNTVRLVYEKNQGKKVLVTLSDFEEEVPAWTKSAKY